MADEWEYEYDGSDTQDFYLTLDLTSRVAPASKKGYVRLEHDIFADPEAEKTQAKDAPPASHRSPDAAAEPDEQDRIQIVGLHDSNPIISYQGHVYSCHWASTIGTDLFFARAPEERDGPGAEPLRRLGTFDLLGASSTRLVATTAKLRQRSEAEKSKQRADAGPIHIFAPIEGPGSLAAVKFPVPENAPRAQKRQADFLERLSAVKVRLGDTDKVRATSYTNRGHGSRNMDEDGEGANGPPGALGAGAAPRTFVTSPTSTQSGDYTFVESGGERGSPPARRSRRTRRGSTAARPRRPRRSKYDSPLRFELTGDGSKAGPNVERPTPKSWEELNRAGSSQTTGAGAEAALPPDQAVTGTGGAAGAGSGNVRPAGEVSAGTPRIGDAGAEGDEEMRDADG